MKIIQANCLNWMYEQPDNCIDLVFGSPPYAGKGERYGDSRKWEIHDWINWMHDVTIEAVRLSRGYVFWVVNGFVRKGEYRPACEGLIWSLYMANIPLDRPCIWHKNCPPNRRDYFANAWEYVLAFKGCEKPYFDWAAVAEPPKYQAGGRFRQRNAKGERRIGNAYPKGKLARPRDVIYVPVGGGHMGHKLAHENEAPYPVALAEHFIKACCPPVGTVLDPFLGSGTTLHACQNLGREGIGLDVRESQILLSERRLWPKQS